MSMTNGGEGRGQPQNPMVGQAQNQAPQLNVMAQYVKDFSFENPNAPRSLAPNQTPSVNLQINVNANPLAATDFEVELKLEGRTEVAGMVMFSFDLVYAGVFRIVNVPQEDLNPIIMIECPRLLFPFAREFVGAAVRGGGFPQFLIEPIDFVTLYRQKLGQQTQPSTPVA